MVEKFKAIRDAYKAMESALEAKLATVRSRITLFDEMIAEEGGLASNVTAGTTSPTDVKDSDIVEIHL